MFLQEILMFSSVSYNTAIRHWKISPSEEIIIILRYDVEPLVMWILRIRRNVSLSSSRVKGKR